MFVNLLFAYLKIYQSYIYKQMMESILPFVQEVNVGYITILCMACENANINKVGLQLWYCK